MIPVLCVGQAKMGLGENGEGVVTVYIFPFTHCIDTPDQA